jgi:hypothetical protein
MLNMNPPSIPEQDWYAVRCVFLHRVASTYEERILIWKCDDIDQAIELAESEAQEYAEGTEGVEYVGLAQAYHLFDTPGHGAEVFSLMRDSSLPSKVYLDTYFDTGAERQTMSE